ncbi:FAD:protein FMN transferase (plasmid) [Aquabacterium olei]|jgi:thiamine biosynthesis lipoprotein|uniref:FAD:protein FMN transferase n=1 Tax=Aquabacterium olei TaxID=1296669 RepID=A0A2U8FYL5_9BURK|nr:FAD:protein FMN transferase [Aquabacterium olei]AWI55504.1 FAD:protein FMN transferase [Aquabacterium olei]
MNTTRRRLCQAMGLGTLWALGTGHTAPATTELVWRERRLQGFGTTLTLKAAHSDIGALADALDESVALLQHLDQILSLFREDSAVRQLNDKGELKKPPAELVKVLEVAQSISARCDGKFDVTVQPLWDAFEGARRRGGVPDERRLAAARALVGWRNMQVEPERIRFSQKGMGITLNGIAQGHAADRVKALLQSYGVQHALIDTGEWLPVGRSVRQVPWVLGVADPRDESRFITRLVADGRALATSADSTTTFTADFRNHHIFDPRTGRSPLGLSGVTVAAPSGALADALTKVFFVAGPDQVDTLARQWGVDVLWVDKQGNRGVTAGLREI